MKTRLCEDIIRLKDVHRTSQGYSLCLFDPAVGEMVEGNVLPIPELGQAGSLVYSSSPFAWVVSCRSAVFHRHSVFHCSLLLCYAVLLGVCRSSCGLPFLWFCRCPYAAILLDYLFPIGQRRFCPAFCAAGFDLLRNDFMTGVVLLVQSLFLALLLPRLLLACSSRGPLFCQDLFVLPCLCWKRPKRGGKRWEFVGNRLENC
ncbi:hypothetical protein BDV98DRAFT_417431 [Pterulicium gracile]|uniref:Uncharacterized protein n=1 Tax=Pterulicium gracile TaxID=1884261 RepID=A0A5C3QMW5_9AGAR|nr:hypothetical protein BDV98DRAFT_417431 [Pterula gracilis]